jgi:glycosyltransferase involved in cell wall biosynthesis
MRLLQAMAGAEFGGAEAFFMRLAVALQRTGIEQRVLIRRNNERAATLQRGSIEPVQLPFGGFLDLFTPFAFRREVRAFKPDVVLTWMNRATSRCPEGPFVHVGRLGGYYDLKYYRRCDHLVGNTRDLRDWFVAQGWPAARAHHVPNFAYDLAGAVPAALPAPPGARRLLAMGRLHANKAFDVLLRALPSLPAAHLSLAGEGPQRAALERLTRELGVAERVAFLGWRQDIGPLLAGCEVFVCPSRHEPLGNVVLEAWSAARPVVAAAAQGPVELIEDGVTGLLVPKDDPAALADALGRVLADPARAAALAAAGRAEFERAHAEAPVLARWCDFLRAVAPSKAEAA